MHSKRSKRNFEMPSPSSSTPACLRHGYMTSPQSTFDNIPLGKDSDTDNSGDNLLANCSPVAPRFRIADVKRSPLEVDTRTPFFAHPRIMKISEDISPDISCSIDEVSARVSLNNSGFSDHLQHSLSYAKQLELRALHLSNRLNTSANLSMSPRLLFSSETAQGKSEEPVSEYRKRSHLVDDMKMQTCNAISQQTVSNVDRILRFSEVCPEIVKSQTPNRFLSKLRPGPKKSDINSKIFHPILNCSCLVGSFSALEELSRTPLAVLYKGRHRLSGVMFCLKRSRCEFELEKTHGGTLSEILNEVQALALLQHPNVIRYYSSWFESESIFLQLEYCLGGSLFNYLHPNRSLDTSEGIQSPHIRTSSENEADSSAADVSTRCLSESLLTILSAHIISALHYMHTTWSMVHGDVKPSNILIQLNKPEAYLASAKHRIDQEAKEHCYTLLEDGDVSRIVFKLADFGRSSKAGEDRDGENLGDGRYLPRLNDPSPPARAAMGRDIYALGITLYHAAGGPMAPSVWERLRETNCLPDVTVLPISLQQIVRTMLRPLAQDRPTAPELINWPSFRPYLNVRQEDIEIGSQKMELE